uniref:ZP domain-containing protein n=1 Tax=Plectus sambesii TaxID=2011161 RepID=A0A914X016_9BILA
MFVALFRGVLLALLSSLASSVVIDNQITSAQLICTDRDLQLHAVVKTPLFQEGRAFVKDHSRDPSCQHVYQRSTTDNALMFRIPLNTCGMVRTSQYAVDRAYRLTCEYTRAVGPTTKDFTVALAVSMLPTTLLPGRGVSGPGEEERIQCSYKLYLGDFQQYGIRQEAKYARVGDKVTHVWECSNLSPNHFIWVHDCIVNPEFSSNNDPVAIDARGCTLDPVIMSELEYQGPLYHTAIGHHHAYKFADYPNLLFKCSINICDRTSPSSCVYADRRAVIVPPICTRLQSRRKRLSNVTTTEESNSFMMEVLSDTLEVAQLSLQNTNDDITADDDVGAEKRIVCLSEKVWLALTATSVVFLIAIGITAAGLLKFARFSNAKPAASLSRY